MSLTYNTFGDILEDVLFRAGESEGGQVDYIEAAKRYILRAYAGVATGSEELTRRARDWWWLRRRGMITLQGEDGAGRYQLPDYVQRVEGSVWDETGNRIEQASIEDVYSSRLRQSDRNQLTRIPTLYAIEANPEDPERLIIQFNRDGMEEELTYIYVEKPLFDEWDPAAEPLLPKELRRILADYALYFLFVDKNDDRSEIMARSTQAAYHKMTAQDRRHKANPTPVFASISPRPILANQFARALDHVPYGGMLLRR